MTTHTRTTNAGRKPHSELKAEDRRIKHLFELGMHQDRHPDANEEEQRIGERLVWTIRLAGWARTWSQRCACTVLFLRIGIVIALLLMALCVGCVVVVLKWAYIMWDWATIVDPAGDVGVSAKHIVSELGDYWFVNLCRMSAGVIVVALLMPIVIVLLARGARHYRRLLPMFRDFADRFRKVALVSSMKSWDCFWDDFCNAQEELASAKIFFFSFEPDGLPWWQQLFRGIGELSKHIARGSPPSAFTVSLWLLRMFPNSHTFELDLSAIARAAYYDATAGSGGRIHKERTIYSPWRL